MILDGYEPLQQLQRLESDLEYPLRAAQYESGCHE